MLDKLVLKTMKNYKAGSGEYKALNALHQDLQPGKGNWQIKLGSLPKGEQGVTSFSTGGIIGRSDFKITEAGPTTIDPNQNATGQDWQRALATEGGAYEVASGRAGPSALEQETQAVEYQNIEHGGDDIDTDNLTNALYNDPLGLEDDP